MSPEPVSVTLEFTPNPSSLKYAVNRRLLERGTADYRDADAARGSSSLAAKLFASGGVAGVMVGPDFVTVTKAEEGDWDTVHAHTTEIIRAHLEAGEPAVESMPAAVAATSGGTEDEKRIREVIDREIRPAVAMDGGDIVFDRYQDGVVFVHLHGACSGCPSSTMTLRAGIEQRLRQLVPDVREVVAI